MPDLAASDLCFHAAQLIAQRKRRPVPFHVVINPKIQLLSPPALAFFEGCLSLPGFTAIVPRAHRALVECLNHAGDPVRTEAERALGPICAILTIGVVVLVVQFAMPSVRESLTSQTFNLNDFLTAAGKGRQMLSFLKGQTIFAQGDASDAVFIVQTGLVTLSARPQGTKETSRHAVIDIFGAMDFVGKCSIAGEPLRSASARALTYCSLLRIGKKTMKRALAREVTLSNALCTSLLARNTRYQQDLVDQRCSNSEGRLARVLLRLAKLDAQSSPETKMERISHKVLAEMVGTTRSRVCAFMKKFEAAGFIRYEPKSRRMRVSGSLIEAIPDSFRFYT